MTHCRKPTHTVRPRYSREPSGKERSADLDVGALPDQQDLVELDRTARLGRQLLDADDVTCGDAILLAACRNDRVHDGETPARTGAGPAERRAMIRI
jgi:hypothetical protein